MGLNGQGGDNWSESAYIHNFLKYSLNVTDQALAGGSLAPFWVNVYVFSVPSQFLTDATSANAATKDMTICIFQLPNG